jgi:anti-sigma-K factor RskA
MEAGMDEDEAKMWRWVAVCAAVVAVVCTIGCGVAYVVHPKQWMCAVVISGDKCDTDGNLIR